MRFRITKNKKGSKYTIVVSGALDEQSYWDVLQVAQTMLGMPLCHELVLDFRGVILLEEVPIVSVDLLASTFEEIMLTKDSLLSVRLPGDLEFNLRSDRLPLGNVSLMLPIGLEEVRFLGKAVKWMEPPPRFLLH